MRRLSIMSVAVALAFAAPALAAGRPEVGRALAERWCYSCHEQTDAAPTLEAAANRPGRTPGTLRAWLTAPHPPMPDPGLTTREIDDIVAYLASLQHGR